MEVRTDNKYTKKSSSRENSNQMRGAEKGQAEMSGDTQENRESCRVYKRVEMEEKAALRECEGWY